MIETTSNIDGCLAVESFTGTERSAAAAVAMKIEPGERGRKLRPAGQVKVMGVGLEVEGEGCKRLTRIAF